MSYWDTLAGAAHNTQSGQLNKYQYKQPATPFTAMAEPAVAAAMKPVGQMQPANVGNLIKSGVGAVNTMSVKALAPQQPFGQYHTAADDAAFAASAANMRQRELDQQRASQRLSALQGRRSQVEGLNFQRQANPFAQGGDLWNRTMDDASSRPSAGLQQALLNNQQSLAERGITADSGLAQQAGLQARNEAAKMAAQFGNQAALGLGQRGAEFDDAETQRQREFDRYKANALDAFNTGNEQLIDQFTRFAADQERDQYGRRLDAQLDPLRVQEAQQGLQRGGLLNQYQQMQNQRYGSMTPLELAQMQQGLDQGAFSLERARTRAPWEDQLMAGQVAQQGAALENLRDERDFYTQNKGLYDAYRQAQLSKGVMNFGTDMVTDAIPAFAFAKSPAGQQVIGIAGQIAGKKFGF